MPPLPEPITHGVFGPLFNRHQMRDFALAAIAAHEQARVVGEPVATGPLSYVCVNGCGYCGVRLSDFVTHQTMDQDSDVWKVVASEPQIVSTCCGSAVEVWDERKQDVTGKVEIASPPAPQAVPPELDVRKIMLAVVPGDDGMGLECYAESVADVEAKLSEMGERLEDWELGIRRLAAPVAQPATEQADKTCAVCGGSDWLPGCFTDHVPTLCMTCLGNKPVPLPLWERVVEEFAGLLQQVEVFCSKHGGADFEIGNALKVISEAVDFEGRREATQPTASKQEAQGGQWTDEQREELEAVIACLGDDAAQLRETNPEDERADNMDRAATLLEQLAATPATPAQAEQDSKAERDAIRTEIINTPELRDFATGAVLEAFHQRERWGSEHDAGKTPADWFWLVGYLAGKALHAQTSGNTDKALHHTISTAAALANWHAAITGEHTAMRPGIDLADRTRDAGGSAV